jgi:hypothetical protein
VPRDGSGVVVRGDSVQISFQFEGRQCRPTLHTAAGRPLAPTPANIKYATRLLAGTAIVIGSTVVSLWRTAP